MSDERAVPTIQFRVVAHHADFVGDEIAVGFAMTAWRGIHAKEQVFAFKMATSVALREFPIGARFRLVPEREEAS